MDFASRINYVRPFKSTIYHVASLNQRLYVLYRLLTFKANHSMDYATFMCFAFLLTRRLCSCFLVMVTFIEALVTDIVSKFLSSYELPCQI